LVTVGAQDVTVYTVVVYTVEVVYAVMEEAVVEVADALVWVSVTGQIVV
jgi:hypothetical protein